VLSVTPVDPESRELLALNLIPGIGPRLTAALLERFGSAAAVRRASAAQLRQVPYLGEALAGKLAASLHSVDVEAELGAMERHRVWALALKAPGYPTALATIPNPPFILYCRGSLTEKDNRAVGIVGSRHCTAYGRRMAERIAGDLARAGYTVVSGLARGIDGAAHRGALQAGGRTIAVLAGGLSRIYPPEHKELAEQVEAAGALLTEATMQQEPLPTMFPARNRIISGLSQAVVLVEAAEKSGALITAEHAALQGRLVFAVPGPADAESSAGTNALIRDGATLCRGAADVLEELTGLAGMGTAAAAAEDPAPAPSPPALDADQLRVWELLAEGPRHMDDLVQGLGWNVSKLAGLLLTLEMKRAVRRLPGNRYERS
jgi:DNA processing protein